MSNSHVYNCLNIHFVFGTKHHHHLLPADHRDALNSKIEEICQKEGCRVWAVNNYKNHVHLLLNVPGRLAPAGLMRVVKANSSRWYREYSGLGNKFSWQTGYSMFAVEKERLPQLKSYINNNPEIHKARERRRRERAENKR